MRQVTHKRINITLPSDTIKLIDQVARKGDRSRFLDEAVRHFVKETGKAKLQQLLKEGAIRRKERDLTLAKEWFLLEEDSWQKTNRK